MMRRKGAIFRLFFCTRFFIIFQLLFLLVIFHTFFNYSKLFQFRQHWTINQLLENSIEAYEPQKLDYDENRINGFLKNDSKDFFDVYKVQSISWKCIPPMMNDPKNFKEAEEWRDFHKHLSHLYNEKELDYYQRMVGNTFGGGRPPVSPWLRRKPIHFFCMVSEGVSFEMIVLQYLSVKKFVRDFLWEFILVVKKKSDNVEILELLKKHFIGDSRVSIMEISEVNECSEYNILMNNVMEKEMEGFGIILSPRYIFTDHINLGKLFVEEEISLGGVINQLGENKLIWVEESPILFDIKRIPDLDRLKFGKKYHDINFNFGDCGGTSFEYLLVHEDVREKLWSVNFLVVDEKEMDRIFFHYKSLQQAVERNFGEGRKFEYSYDLNLLGFLGTDVKQVGDSEFEVWKEYISKR